MTEAHPPTCLGAYTHTRIHTYMLVPHIQTTIHASCMLVQNYPPRANANKAALVPDSCTGRDTSIENLPYPGLAECLPATSIVSTPTLIVINDSRIDTQSPMAIGKQMANDNKEREKKLQQGRARQHFLRQPTRTRSRYLAASTARVCSSRLPSNLMATAEQHIHTCPPTYTYIMYVRTHMHPDHLLVPTCAIRHQKRSPS
ncbi:hypothetical protein J3E69DRAFT_333357 [Trichoderma sp. SZMC 28015]